MTRVTCPNCSATYQIDSAKLAQGGRKLKCAQCQTLWLAKASEADDAVAQPAKLEGEAAGVMPEGGVLADPVESVDDFKPAEEAPLPEEVLVQRTPGLDSVTKVGGWRQRLRGESLWRTGALVMLVLGVLAGGWVAWSTIMAPDEDAPVAMEAEVAGPTTTDMAESPAGVVLHRVVGEVSEVDSVQGGVALTVRGLLANTTDASLTVPALRLELLAPDGSVADMWPVSGVDGTLAPQSEQAWTVSVTAPDLSAVQGWRVVFVKDRNAPPTRGLDKLEAVEGELKEEPAAEDTEVAPAGH